MSTNWLEKKAKQGSRPWTSSLRKGVLKENLKNNKASQHSDIVTKIIKSNSDTFSDFLYISVNS